MSKTVKFDVQGYDKSFEIMDTMANTKKVSEGLRRIYKAMDKIDEEAEKSKQSPLLVDYGTAILDAVMTNVAELLGLSSTEKKKLADTASSSDIMDFYDQCVSEFLDLDMPTMERLKENLGIGTENAQNNANGVEEGNLQVVDPKHTEEN